MNICFHANCQALGLQYFFERSPDAHRFTTKVIQDFQVVLGEVSKEAEREAIEEADVIFYHALSGRFPVDEWKPAKTPVLIPMSVWHNSGPFLTSATSYEWHLIAEYARKHSFNDAVHYAVHEADMGYMKRWSDNFQKMTAKERRERVPENTRISGWTHEGIERRMHLTRNHPTTEVFVRWANLLLEHIGMRPVESDWTKRMHDDLNIVGLPCEDFAPSGACAILGLGWGGDDASNQWNYDVARRKLKEFALE